MIVKTASHMLAPDVCIYTEVINIETLHIPKHRIILHLFQNAEAVAQHPAILNAHKDGTAFILQQVFQIGNAVFLGTSPEQIRTDLMMNFPYLFQQFDHTGNIRIVCKTDLHWDHPPINLIIIYHSTILVERKAGVVKSTENCYHISKGCVFMDYVNCILCPRQCGADRTAGQLGFCGCPDTALVAKTMLHKWEEPALAGNGGSGAVFFGGCTLKCRYCQNATISCGPVGIPMDSARLRQTFEDLIAQGAENIDLVTPTHFLPTILPALSPKLPVPVVYNCGGYERVETLRQLEGKVDIYLPDLKYAEARLAKSLSAAADYFPRAKNAIREMVRQTGPVQWNGDKIVRGVIIRHLILPGHVDNSLKVLDWIGANFAPGEVLVSLMRQYTPMGGLPAPLDRRVTDEEYDAVLSWMYLNDLEGFTQEAEAADSVFIPDF